MLGVLVGVFCSFGWHTCCFHSMIMKMMMVIMIMIVLRGYEGRLAEEGTTSLEGGTTSGWSDPSNSTPPQVAAHNNHHHIVIIILCFWVFLSKCIQKVICHLRPRLSSLLREALSYQSRWIFGPFVNFVIEPSIFVVAKKNWSNTFGSSRPTSSPDVHPQISRDR